MGNKVVRIIIGIIIGCALLVGIYFILPGQYHYRIKEFIQKTFNKDYKTIVRELKTKQVPGYDITFDTLMKKGTEKCAWTVEKLSADKAGNGTYYVYADGYKVDMDVEHKLNEDTNKSFSNAHVRLSFEVNYQDKKITSVKLFMIKVDQENFGPSTVYYPEILEALKERAVGK